MGWICFPQPKEFLSSAKGFYSKGTPLAELGSRLVSFIPLPFAALYYLTEINLLLKAEGHSRTMGGDTGGQEWHMEMKISENASRLSIHQHPKQNSIQMMLQTSKFWSL